MKIHIILISILLVVLTCNTEAQKKGEGVVPPMNIQGEPWQGYVQHDDDYYVQGTKDNYVTGTYVATKEMFEAFVNTFYWSRILVRETISDRFQRQWLRDEWDNTDLYFKTWDFKIGMKKRYLKSRGDTLYTIYVSRFIHSTDEYDFAKEEPMRYILMKAGLHANEDESVKLLLRLEAEYDTILSNEKIKI